MPLVAPHAMPGRAGVAPAFATHGLEALYLMEIERRNLLKWSEALSDRGIASNISILVDSGYLDPFGRNHAARYLASSSVDQHRIKLQDAYVGDAGQHTFSIYVKGLGGDVNWFVALEGMSDVSAYFNIASQEVTKTDTNVDSASIEDVGSGWVRCSLVCTAPAGNLLRPYLRINEGIAGTTNDTFSGNETTEGFYVYGAQINKGSTALPYVPTSNKRAVYDYSGKGNHAHLGSAGVAFINPVGGPKALNLPGATSDYASGGDVGAVTGDIDLRAKVHLESWTPSTYRTLLGRYEGGDNRDYLFRLEPDGSLLYIYATAPAESNSVNSPALGLTDGELAWVRVTHDLDVDGTNGEIKFYTSSDGESWTLIDTQSVPALGSTRSATSTSLEVGRYPQGSGPFLGKIYRAQVYDGIDGTLVADFNAEDAHGDVTQFYSSTTGELWTISQSAATTNDPTWTGEGLDFDGTDDYVKVAGNNVRSSLDGASGQSLTVVVDPTGSPSHEGLVDEYHGLIGFSRPALQFRTFTSQPGAGYFIRGDVLINGGSQDTLYNLPAEEDGPVMYTTDVSVETNEQRNFRNGVLVDTETDVADITTLNTTGSSFYIGSIDNQAGGTSTPSEMPTMMAAVYSRAPTEAEAAQNYRAAKHLLAQRGVAL